LIIIIRFLVFDIQIKYQYFIINMNTLHVYIVFIFVIINFFTEFNAQYLKI